MTFYKKVEIIT